MIVGPLFRECGLIILFGESSCLFNLGFLSNTFVFVMNFVSVLIGFLTSIISLGVNLTF